MIQKNESGQWHLRVETGLRIKNYIVILETRIGILHAK
jgi:hypothetical protein